MIKQIISQLPTEPGIYQMLDSVGIIIYIGKARNIRKRVSQYFNRQGLDLKTQLLVRHIHDIQPIITKNDHEALLLENQLIKTHQPKYNVLLKDDKSYPYIKITIKEPFPRIIVTRQKINDGSLYFGPYTSYGSTRRLRAILYDLFPIRDCKQAIDLEIKQPKCIKLDLEQCIGPCIKKDVKSEYDQIIQNCILFLSGKNTQIIAALKEKMQQLSDSKAYEKASQIRDKIKHLEQLQIQRSVNLKTNHNHFLIGVASSESHHYIICQQFRQKQFISQKGYFTNEKDSLDLFLGLTIAAILGNAPQKTTLIIDETLTNHIEHIIKLHPNNHKLSIIHPKKGDLRELLDLANLNAKKSLIGISNRQLKSTLPSPLLLLKKDLSLPTIPTIIFGCDISHYYGTNIVSSVVVFIDGKPAKRFYRHFKIKSVSSGKSDDVKSMKETIERLIDHYDMVPDLLLIDGGKGQLNASLDALSKKNMSNIPCIALAKKNEEIYIPSKQTPLNLPYHHSGLNLLRHIRDEAHRFAVTFQRSQRKNN